MRGSLKCTPPAPSAGGRVVGGEAADMATPALRAARPGRRARAQVSNESTLLEFRVFLKRSETPVWTRRVPGGLI